MRSLILKQIEEYRDCENGFPHDTMRWDDFFFVDNEGIVRYTSWRAAKKTGAIHISETTNEHFSNLTDEALLRSFLGLTRQRGKQM